MSNNSSIAGGLGTVTTVAMATGALLFVVGLIGNSFVIVINSCTIFKQKPHNLLVSNLAVIDILILFFSSLVGIMSVVDDHGRLLRENQDVCNLAGAVAFLVYTVSITAMAALALNRYVCISKPIKSKSIFTHRTCASIVVLTWVYNIIIFMPPLFGWGSMEFDEKLFFCGPAEEGEISYNIVSGFLSIFLPSFITAACYVGIFIKVVRSKQQVHAHAHGDSDTRVVERREQKMALQMFIIVFIFYLSWLPYVLVVRLDSSVDAGVAEMMAMLLSFNSVVNPFIYLYFNKGFREEFLRIIRCGRRSQAREQRSTSATVTDVNTCQ